LFREEEKERREKERAARREQARKEREERRLGRNSQLDEEDVDDPVSARRMEDACFLLKVNFTLWQWKTAAIF
jgi:hypothetical protein